MSKDLKQQHSSAKVADAAIGLYSSGETNYKYLQFTGIYQKSGKLDDYEFDGMV